MTKSMITTNKKIASLLTPHIDGPFGSIQKSLSKVKRSKSVKITDQLLFSVVSKSKMDDFRLVWSRDPTVFCPPLLQVLFKDTPCVGKKE